MKNFNEWLSFRSNSYHEMDNNEDSAFNIQNISGPTNPSSVNLIEEKFKKLVDMYGGSAKIKNKMTLLVEIIKSIYDFDDENQLNKIKTDLRTIINKLQVNDNLDDIDNIEDDDKDELR